MGLYTDDLALKEFSEKYLELLKGPFGGINLTRILDSEEFFTKQILDSIIPYEKSEKFRESIERAQIILDVGFGGGFPILPLAKILPQKKFLGLEARGKKVKAVNEIAGQLDLANVQLRHQRLEEVLLNRDCFILFKAVGEIADCLKLINILEGVRARVFFYKGPNPRELEAVEGIKGWQLIEDLKIDLGTEQRTLLGYENKNVPRGTIRVKEVVKLTDII